ncbi:MAG TPA: prephenate dehydrogenase/arogenate dehydrogenase family protein [Ktedonobacterales bacterium]
MADETLSESRVAIIGLGLMGGSLGLALRAAAGGERLAASVTGYDRAPEVAERAVARGALDRACESLAEAARDADLLVIATPTLAAEDALRALAGYLKPGAVVTDLCSVKGRLVALAASLGPDLARRYVGGHPMAGSERAGIEAATADLYRGARWALTPTTATDPAALARVRALVAALGAEVIALDAEAHDSAVAGISHLPLALAVALTRALAEDADWPTLAALAAGGYRDATRVAAGDPLMGRDMLLANRAALLVRLDAFSAALAELREALERGDAAAVEAALRTAQRERLAWGASRK